MGIVEFLRARLDEDEAAALAAQPDSTWLRGKTWWLEGVEHEMVTTPNGDEVAFTHLGYVDHIARHDPARVLREVEAKRGLIEVAYDYAATIDGEWGCAHNRDEIVAGKCHVTDAELMSVLTPLAAVYADHPDYRQEWAQG